MLARHGPAPFTVAERAGGNLAVPAEAILAGIVHCAACGRAPLVGEWATLRRGDGGEGWVCELCDRDGEADGHGRPVRRERVRTVAGAINVRRLSH